MKIKPSLIAIAMAAMGATAAHAPDDIYFGAGVGATHFNGLNKIEGVNAGEEDAAAANAFVGYNFNEYFGSELGYQYTGRGNTNGNRYGRARVPPLSGIARLPLGNDFSLFGEAGAIWGTPTVWAPAIPRYPAGWCRCDLQGQRRAGPASSLPLHVGRG